jgi:hypothetical protein
MALVVMAIVRKRRLGKQQLQAADAAQASSAVSIPQPDLSIL